jgi:hypothetical protein
MALLGSSIDPRLQLQDYSGIVNAAQMQAQGLASIGSQIEAAAQQYKQYKKEQQDTQKRVKAAANLADSISALVPELKGPLGATVAQLKDPNLTLSDKDALAQSISSTLQLGIGVVAGNQDRALRQEEIGLKRGMIAAEAQAEKDLLVAKANKEEEERNRMNLGDLAFAKGAIGTITNATPATKSLIVNLINRGEGTYARQALSAVKDFTQGTDRISDVNAQGQIVIIDKNTGETFPAWTREDVALATPEGSIGQAASMQTPPPDPNVISGAIQPGVNAEDVGRFDERGMPTRRPGEVPEIAAPALLPLLQPSATPEQIRTAAGAAPQAQPGRKPVMARVPASEEAAKIKTELDKAKLNKMAEDQKIAAASIFEKSNRMVDLMTKLEQSPGFDDVFGFGFTGIPGTEGANSMVLFKQIQALGFMEAIKDMKGMGALSNAEGEKASAAFLGISPEMSEKAAREKIKEVVGYIEKGQARLKTGKLVEPERIEQTPVGGANSFFKKFQSPQR